MLHMALVLLRKLIIPLITAMSSILTTTRDTQWNTTQGFIKSMILYREVQAEAQREIDRVIGSDRLPVWEDQENLPNIRGVVEESLRCIQSLANFEWTPANYLRDANNFERSFASLTLKGRLLQRLYDFHGSSTFINVWTLNSDVKNNPRIFDPTCHSPESTA
jgi:hypothetical protein